MGTDIHLQVEVYQKGKWQRKYKAERFRFTPRDKQSFVKNYYGYEGRNYLLFGILAGVRKAMSEFPTISPPRGLPPDVSAAVAAKVAEDTHNHSWLTLEELLAYDWCRACSMDDFDGRNLAGLDTLRQIYKEYKMGFIDLEGVALKDLVGSFYSETLMRLTLLSDNPKHVRIVFWFDS